MTSKWLHMSASDLGRGIDAGEIDPVDLTDTYLEAIENHPDQASIYACTTPERARSEATEASERAKNKTRLSLLDGVPISWKDLFDTQGIPTEAGTRMLEGRIPKEDARVVRNAGDAGLVCLGKTHLTELAFAGLGVNPVTATPPNIHDPERAPGGSSSGAGTSVAFGLAACGIGSDTGGSVRIPSVWNDLVGMKTTHSSISLDGVVPLSARFDTVGPLCRTVEDAIRVIDILTARPTEDLTPTKLTGASLLVCETVALDELDPEVSEGFAATLDKLANAGAQISSSTVPEVEAALALAACLVSTEAYATWEAEIESKGDLMFHQVRDRFRTGADFSGVEFVQGWQKLDRLRQSYVERTAGYDAVLMPTCAILPPLTERLLAEEDYYISSNLKCLRNTRIGNMLGLCALTLPTGIPSVGFMLCGAPHSDDSLLRLGLSVEDTILNT